MSHITIVINATTPPPTAAAATSVPDDSYSVSVEYKPRDGATSSQIGNEVARIQRRVNQIIEGTTD